MSEPVAEPTATPTVAHGSQASARPTAEPTAVFQRDGERFVPTLLAQGPWAAGAMHGGPMGALLAHLCESAPGGRSAPGAQAGDLRVARITVDLLRPAPLTPLQPVVRIARPGRKVDWVDASVFAGDVEVGRATALRMGGAAVDPPAGIDPWGRGESGDAPFDGGPADGVPFVRDEDGFVPGFHNLSAELRFVRSLPTGSGPGQVWVRLRHPMVEGVPTSPLMRTMAAADFGNAASSLLPLETHSYINADLVVALWRDPATEWIGLDAVTRFDPARGTGLAEVALHDEQGPIGRGQQSVLLSSR